MIKKELQDYIEKEIFPEYEKNEEAHNIEHIKYVIRRSLAFAKQLKDSKEDMVYTIAAYHDIAHHIDAKNHEIVSAQIAAQDKQLRNFFTEAEIQTIKEAIEDHRSSKKEEPRTIYGKIIKEADRNTQIEQPFKRTFSYRKEHNKEDTLDKIIEESRLHLIEKYGKHGYATQNLFFKDEEYTLYLKELNKLLNDKTLFKKKYLEINKINEKEYELERARRLCDEVSAIAHKYDLEYFFITEGASCCNSKKNEAIKNARKEHKKWEE